jgi:hypothetical protein
MALLARRAAILCLSHAHDRFCTVHQNARRAASARRRTSVMHVSTRYCIQYTLVAGTCACQRLRVAFFMRRYVSACTLPRGPLNSSGSAARSQKATSPVTVTRRDSVKSMRHTWPSLLFCAGLGGGWRGP